MLDEDKLSLESVLEAVPKKDGISDIAETEYDPTLIPYLVALVAKKKLRAVFLHETSEEKALREQFLAHADTPEFWRAMQTLTYRNADEDDQYNNTVYSLDLSLETPEIELTSVKRFMLEGPVPQLITHAAQNHANIFRSSFLSCSKPEIMVFAGRENGGLLAGEMHTDPSYGVSSHKTVLGRRGMGCVLEPLTDEQREHRNVKPLEFREWIYKGGLPIHVILAGTTTIFGTEFMHESSPEEQVSVVMSTDHKYELVHGS